MKYFRYGVMTLIGAIAMLYGQAFAGPYQGLWTGQIEINKVNEVGMNATDTVTPKPVSNPFDMPILLHVDAEGKVKLLREVTVMQETLTSEANGETTQTVQRVLVINDAKLTDYEGVVRRDGKLVGIRLGSLAFDFSQTLNKFPLTGAFGAGTAVTGTLVVGKDHPNNPFRHLYHPDHKSGRRLEREITLTFDAEQTGNTEAGISLLKGDYKEVVTGIHKIPVRAEGRFELQQVSSIGQLIE